MVVVAPGRREMQRRSRGPGKALEDMRDELERQGADPLRAERQVQDGIGTAADVDHGLRDGLVHRHHPRHTG